LLNASTAEFRKLVQAALQTGALRRADPVASVWNSSPTSPPVVPAARSFW
jgi:hypothetical protein